MTNWKKTKNLIKSLLSCETERDKYKDFFDFVVEVITEYQGTKEEKYDLIKQVAEKLNIGGGL